MRDSVRVESCTIVDNTARFGGGIVTVFGPGVVVSNSILWGNRALTPSQGDQVYSNLALGVPDIVLRYCDIEGGPAGVAGAPNPMIQLIATVDVDPELVDRANGDYHLTGTSPLIGAGDPELAVQPFEGDQDGEPRVNGLLDLGADEHYAGLALAYPAPGRAGEPNTLSARGSPPGGLVLFYAGFQAGTKGLGFESCPDLALEIADGALLAVAKADALGTAQHRGQAPAALVGQTLLLQALAFDPSSPALTCTRSNLVSFGFP